MVQLVRVSLPRRSKRSWSGDIIMELMDRDLRTLIENRMWEKKGQGVPFSQREANDIIIQIARAIQHLHMKGCMHRGIKSSNILFNDHGSYVDVKITDFGVSTLVVREDVYASKDTYAPNIGSSRWMAHEVRPMLPIDIGGKLSDLIQDCWNSDPTRVPTATEICAILDEIKYLDTHDGGFMHFAIAKKFLNLTRPTVHRMKRFFHLFGQRGFEDIETLEVEVVSQLDGTESSRSTPNIQGLSRYLCMDPSTFQALWRIHGHEEDSVQVVGIEVGGCKYVIKTVKNIEGQEQSPSFRFELDFLIKLHYPHIVRLMGIFPRLL
ncbi:unnamed protein product [Sphagnum jensenii]|uniref:Protein kinase domain-containing protein n=1 Tax=Sphagnum jensenii TaxID=128206 RepID=A0ABP1ATR2_9BRYO